MRYNETEPKSLHLERTENMSQFRFAVAGSGHIARKFVGGLTFLPEAELAAAASRNIERAESLVSEFSSFYPHAKAYASYEELAADDSIDAVYVANLNPQHEDAVILFLNSGKAVLCEKPFALNAQSTARMIDAARKNDLFLMEAMWTRFLPVTKKVRSWIDEGRIGEIISASCDFGMELMTSADNRTVVLEKGGGSLLDLGIYPISFFSYLFGGPPNFHTSVASIADSGVDASFDAILRYGEKRSGLSSIMKSARTSVAIDRNLPNQMTIIGTKGMIRIHNFWMANKAERFSPSENWGFDNLEEVYEPIWEGTGYQYEAAEVIAKVRAGEKESSVMPLDETLSIMKTMDGLRHDFGIVFPQEKE